jgi:hypothetical protein
LILLVARDGDQVRQQVIATLGRFEELQASGQLDAADRASIVAALERQLAKGAKALVGNTGYRLTSRRSAMITSRSIPTRSRRTTSSKGKIVRQNRHFQRFSVVNCACQCGTQCLSFER